MKQEVKIQREKLELVFYDNIIYAHRMKRFKTGFIPLSMNIVRPMECAVEPFQKRPLLVFIGGGGWKDSSPCRMLPGLMQFSYAGYVLASVGYRTTGMAPYPAQLQDVKAAIRFLKAHADIFGIDKDRVAVMGESAGGHLADLVAVTVGEEEYITGDYPEESDAVKAVISLYTPVDMERMDRQPKISPVWPSAEELLIGGPVEQYPEMVAKVNPITYLTKDAPPFLLMHGNKDVIVSCEQSQLMYDKLTELGVPAEFYVVDGAGHASSEFTQPEAVKLMCGFLKKYV